MTATPSDEIVGACEQLLVALAGSAVAEALALAGAAGVDPARVRAALVGGFAHSRVLEGDGLRMAERRFGPGATAEQQRRALAGALDLAHAHGAPLPVAGLALDLLAALVAGGGQDRAELLLLLERLSGGERRPAAAPDLAAAPARERPRVGFVGLGVMGRPIAANLLRAGFALCVHSRSRAGVDALVALGARDAGSPAGVARQSDVIVLSLPDTAAVRLVVAGADGLLQHARPGALIIDTSTIAPLAARELAAAAQARGVAMLDAPVSGGESGAREATLSIMLAGDPLAAAEALPLLRAVGRNITYLGGAGAGQIAKACNQIIVAISIAAVAEALTLARRAGADPAAVREALLAGPAASRVLDLHGRRMIERGFEPGGRARFQLKDLVIALETARAFGAVLPLTRLVAELFRALVARGGADLDHAALVTVIETLAGEPA